MAADLYSGKMIACCGQTRLHWLAPLLALILILELGLSLNGTDKGEMGRDPLAAFAPERYSRRPDGGGIRSSTTAAARTAWNASTSACSASMASIRWNGSSSRTRTSARRAARRAAGSARSRRSSSRSTRRRPSPAADTGAVGGLKIDLSKLFGGDVGDALSAAVQERDRELVNDGRDAVGMTVGIPKRQADKPQGPKDDLDKLVDDLDSLGL